MSKKTGEPVPVYVPPPGGGFEGPLPEPPKKIDEALRRGSTIISGDEKDPREWDGLKADDDL